MKAVEHIINGNRFRAHVLFSLAVLLLLFLGMYFLYLSGFRFASTASAFTDCFFFLLCLYTGRWLGKLWFEDHQPLQFVLYMILACFVLPVLKWLLVRYVFDHPYAGFIEVLRDAMPFFFTGLVIGMLLKLVSVFMRKELNDAQIKAEQKESEFNLLQSQLSPHFLFNVLNNLYGISIEEHQRIPPLLLKLSQLLRYSVYGAKKTLVPLTEELEYIKNYIEFEQIRISDRLNLTTDIESIRDTRIKIAPQVLIVFIENAFKHSRNALKLEIDIHITLKITGNFIHLLVTNSYNKEDNTDNVLDENSGLGLVNTIKRLDLLYKSNYTLKQKEDNGLYYIELCLKIME